MRLIDADALMDVIRQHEYSLATKQGSVDYGMFTLGIQQAVDESTTIDAVPVVRCAECHYSDEAKVNEKGFLICPASGMEITDDDFCSYGERRSDE